MFIIKIKKIVKDSVKSIYDSIKRFPITIGNSLVLVIMLIIINENQFNLNEKTLEVFQRINMTIALGIPLSLCLKLIFEKKDVNKVKEIFICILGIGVLVLYYFYLLKGFDNISITRYVGLNIFLYLAFLYIPWIKNEDCYENYIIKVLGSFFLAIIYSVVLYFGFSAIIFTLDKLFSINIEWKIYYYMSLIVFIVFMPSMFLAKIPYNNYDFSKIDYPKPLKILLLYIIIPLIIIYAAILYAYFIKIIITRNWPIGLISHLVLWYSIIAVGVIFFIHPLIDENKLAKNFIFWFPKIIIPIIMMMFFSIGIRMNQYGITENRYLVLVLGIWVLGIMIYFSATKKLKNIIIPISLSIIVINSIFGPLSSFSISKYSQNKRFENILTRNNMLSNENIVKAESEVPLKDRTETSMILEYFDENHSLNNVKYLPSNFKIGDMEKLFGFSYTYAQERNIEGDEYFYFSTDSFKTSIEINDYDYLIDMNGLIDNEISIGDSAKARYNTYDRAFEIIENEKIIYEKSIEDFVKIIFDKHKNTPYATEIDIQDMTFEDEKGRVKVKFIFDEISLESDDRETIENINDINFHIVLKIK